MTVWRVRKCRRMSCQNANDISWCRAGIRTAIPNPGWRFHYTTTPVWLCYRLQSTDSCTETIFFTFPSRFTHITRLNHRGLDKHQSDCIIQERESWFIFNLALFMYDSHQCCFDIISDFFLFRKQATSNYIAKQPTAVVWEYYQGTHYQQIKRTVILIVASITCMHYNYSSPVYACVHELLILREHDLCL